MTGGTRLAVLAGGACGLVLAAILPVAAVPGSAIAAGLAAAAALIPACRKAPASVVMTIVALAAALIGLHVGAARLRAIDSGAFVGRPGEGIAVLGHVLAAPRRSAGEVRVPIETAAGRLLLIAPEPVPELQVGETVRAGGMLARPPPWLEQTLRRQGVGMTLVANRIDPTGGSRGGLLGRLDAIRDRATAALGAGMPAREAALARGFVLGQDDQIDPATVDEFRRSGLSHLLAVSGQNVMLLILLASPLLAVLGIPLRARLVWLLALVAVYVPLAGGGPSIQRAGVMGVAGVLALLAGRPSSRAFALLAAADATLLLNPRACGDPGWQLSFAAVLGIFLLGPALRDRLLARLGDGVAQRGLAEGAALTISATAATAPLIAHHFGGLPVGTLAANLLALPAVAPAMWLGMLAAALGQVPGAPVTALNWINAGLLAYIAQVAEWFGRPRWAVVSVQLQSPIELAAAYAALVSLAVLGFRFEAWWRLRRRRRQAVEPWLISRRNGALAGVAVAAALVAAPTLAGGERPAAGPEQGLRIEVLDVGQGDAILLQPPGAGAILVDGGPFGGGLKEELWAAGVDRLAAVVLTHDQSDHAGGIAEVLGEIPVGRFVYSSADRRLLQQVHSTGATPYRVAEGSEISAGGMRLEVLWPPRDASSGGDPNQRSVVLLARWRSFEMLLTGDAEAEAVPLDPGPIDVLKVSHHGSEDAGLGSLLERTIPELAVISVGDDNPFGHPAPPTVATLAGRGVPLLRTDRDGTIVIQVGRQGFRAEGEN